MHHRAPREISADPRGSDQTAEELPSSERKSIVELQQFRAAFDSVSSPSFFLSIYVELHISNDDQLILESISVFRIDREYNDDAREV